METKMQNPKPIGYYSVCFYSFKGISYPQENWLFDLKAETYQGLVDKIKNTYLVNYERDPDYKIYEELIGNYPNAESNLFIFEAAYQNQSRIRYYIHIKKIYLESLYD